MDTITSTINEMLLNHVYLNGALVIWPIYAFKYILYMKSYENHVHLITIVMKFTC